MHRSLLNHIHFGVAFSKALALKHLAIAAFDDVSIGKAEGYIKWAVEIYEVRDNEH